MGCSVKSASFEKFEPEIPKIHEPNNDNTRCAFL